MLLTEVSKTIECDKIYSVNIKNKSFKNLCTNSKNAKNSSIFVINSKVKFKKKYIKEAIKNGSIAILTNKYIKGIKLTQFIVKNIDISLSILLHKLYPIPPLNSIAVTGTNGKTSVVWYISKICSLNGIDNKTYGTLGHYVNSIKIYDSNLTTPTYEELYQTAFSKKKNKINYIFEASSHSLDQNRFKKFPVNIAVLTNISQDHLDYHKKFINYKKAKLKLFTKHLKTDGHAIINDKIKGINIFKKKIIKNQKLITYGTNLSNVNVSIDYKKTIIKIYNKSYSVKLIDLTQIELENLACAIACCIGLNIKINKILKVFNKITNPPGRLQLVNSNKNYKIYIDYAHTPDALKKILIAKTINNKKPNIVFGCGGSRDKNKRKIMGIIANKFADKVYITDDNPRDENPFLIRQAILEKCQKGIEIANRKKAISKSIKDLKKNDILIIAGKGHEKIQIFKNHKQYFDDLKISSNELKKLNR